MILKINLHLHTGDDPRDNISYSTIRAIDYASNLGFNVLALTCHRKNVYKQEYGDYAKKKGILLIPGVEVRIEGKDVVILNCDKTIDGVKTMQELKAYRRGHPDIFVIAPHPYITDITRVSLQKKLEKNIDLFDAIELTVFSNKIFNFNKKAIKIAKKYNKPIVATSDTHYLKDLGRGYVLINAQEKTIENIFTSLKEKNFTNKLNSMNILNMLNFRTKSIIRKIFNIHG